MSTDFVFDGTACSPYSPDAEPSPLGAYGRSKLAGERAVVEGTDDALIIRTGWVYSAHGANFVKTMLRLMAERDELSVVADQVGTPTWAAGLAGAGLDREELARAKAAMRGSMLMGLENPVARTTRIGVGEAMRGEVVPVQEHLERIEAVTVDDVRRVCADVLSVAGVLSIVGPSEVRR